MLALVDITDSVIEIRTWVGRWIEVLVEKDNSLEIWVFQKEGVERMGVQYLEEYFHDALFYIQAR